MARLAGLAALLLLSLLASALPYSTAAAASGGGNAALLGWKGSHADDESSPPAVKNKNNVVGSTGGKSVIFDGAGSTGSRVYVFRFDNKLDHLVNTGNDIEFFAKVSPPPSISTTRGDDDLGGGSRTSDSSTLCVQQVSTQALDGVVPLVDGSGRLLCWRRNGQIWLATVDGSVLRVGDKPVVDLGNRVSQDAAARGGGLAGVAVHSSGQLFVSYYTTTDGLDTFLVVDQLSSSAPWSEADQLTTTRVFTMALPDESEPSCSPSGFLVDCYGGQLIFRPTTTDPFLYLVTGPAQTDGQLQAKVLRFRVGGMPSGNGTVTTTEAQVYAAGLGIPRRCVFDADRPQDLYCAIVKDEQELVYLISDPDAPSYSATPPSPSLLVAHHRPTSGTPLSLVGGVLYRGYADTTLVGSYIYMENSQFLVTVASPAHNSSTTRNLRVTCSASATSTCRGGDFTGGRVISFGEDEGKNALLLATDGVYQVVEPSLCLATIHTNLPMSTTRILEWVFGVIGALLATLAGGYGICKCCNRKKNEIHVNASNGNVNIFNGNNDIELGRMGVNN